MLRGQGLTGAGKGVAVVDHHQIGGARAAAQGERCDVARSRPPLLELPLARGVGGAS
ncbi:hypothetical protein GCM10010330_35460 [Streptomyces tendae]|uniref:hypothetical protein n=1 Tax=Streptomyces tendae TaxID=1932 RepID=UPI0019B8ED6F|nr:hypothetical protein [Streptomyces tendae]GHA78691.1 hypothetical protein GCM10010330_35460 [Streptomyces tendae]